jgi:AcrR family transcriptional regulator
MPAPDATPRPLRSDARRNRAALVAAASTVFAHHGVDAAMDAIAREAGVGNATMYRHFPTRDALLEAVLTEHHDALAGRARELLDIAPPDTALIEWLTEFIEYSQTFRGLPGPILATLQNQDSALYASCKAMRTGAAELLTRAQHHDLVRRDIDVSDLLTHAAGIAWAAQRVSPADPDRVRRLLRVMADGLRHSGPE